MLFPWKEKRKKENLSARFSLCTPRGLTLEEKQHVQEVRWDIRKAFSGSIRQAREGKGDRQTEWEMERETPRAQGRGKSWGNSLCFLRVLLHISVGLGKNIQLSSFFHPAELNTQRLGSVRRSK